MKLFAKFENLKVPKEKSFVITDDTPQPQKPELDHMLPPMLPAVIFEDQSEPEFLRVKRHSDLSLPAFGTIIKEDVNNLTKQRCNTTYSPEERVTGFTRCTEEDLRQYMS